MPIQKIIQLDISNFKTIQFDYSFLQRMINRLIEGQHRYGKHTAKKARRSWILRMRLELEQYESTGDKERLINIANYAWLEQMNPEHPNAHFNRESKSATRKWSCRL